MDSPGDNYYRAVKERFEKNISCISSVNDQKSCGTIALKMMKYLTYENIKKILGNSSSLKKDKENNIYIMPHVLPRDFVKYIQSMNHIEYHDNNYDNSNTDFGKYPGTAYNKLISKNKLKLRENKKTNETKLINTTAEEKQKQIISRKKKPVKTSLGGNNISL